ncbi:MAG: hypothetical protein Q9162_002102 [Coniocarpon cinnabarinum]
MAQSILGDDAKAAQLSQLLQALQNPDNVQRTDAESALNSQWLDAQPDALLVGLAEQIQRSPDPAAPPQTRTFAAVLFRRMSNKNKKIKTEDGEDVTIDLYRTLSQRTKDFTRSKLLECLQQEQINTVRDKIGDAVAEIARHGLSRSTDPGQRSAAFRVFSTTPEIIEKEHEQAVMGVFQQGFKDSDLSVRLAAMEAFSSFFEQLNKNAQKKYQYLLPEILSILPSVRNSTDEDHLTRAILAVIVLAEFSPKMFKDHFHDLVTFSIGIVKDKELSDTARQNALELMATFADNAPAMCKRDSNYTTEMVMQCLALMADVGAGDEDASGWNEAEDLDQDESDANHVAGEQTMDRLANKLGGPTLLPPTFEWMPKMLNSSSWQEKHAALMAISAISEGCKDLMEEQLDQVLNLIMPTLGDAHPRVRWAGCNALGQMSTDFAGTMQEKYAERVVPALTKVLEAPESRVQSHAAAALVNFCEEAESEVLQPFLPELLTRLHALLQRPEKYVQEQALSTIATVADSAEAAFSQYYDVLMPLMISALQAPQEKETRLIKSKAMECATLIALAVGREKMGQDAITMMQILDTIQNSITDSDDPQANYLLHSWGRMCRVMSRDFLPYLPRVMPPLMSMASAKADIQMLDDEAEAAQYEGDEGFELVPLKGKFIRINTAVMDDKHTAIELISVYAHNLGGAFEPYVKELMDQVVLQSLTFFFHDPVRAAAAEAIPKLLNAYKEVHGLQDAGTVELWARVIDKILDALKEEPQVENLAEIYECFYECLEVMGDNCLSEDHMSRFIDVAKVALEEYQGRVKERADERNGADSPVTSSKPNGIAPNATASSSNSADAEWENDDEDSEEMQLAIEDDANLLSDMNKAFHNMAKYQKLSFLPYWRRLLPFYQTFAMNPADATMRQWALCVYDDALEFWPSSATVEFMNEYIRPALDVGLKDPNAANRQAACYGVGVAAQFGGNDTPWASYAASCLPLLFAACDSPAARSEEHIYATENACAAIAKVLMHCPKLGVSIDNLPSIAEAWLDTLPVTNDDEAAPWAYGYLSELVDGEFAAAYGRAPKLVKDICEAIAGEVLAGNARARAEGVMRRLYGVAMGRDGGREMRTVVEAMEGNVRGVCASVVGG